MANETLPLSKQQAIKAYNWLAPNFDAIVEKNIAGTPFSKKLIYAIALQETAYKWINWIDKYSTEIILQRCIFDANGDFPGTSRFAFPKNKDAFKKEFGEDFTNMLIKEANLQRKMPQASYPNGFQPASFLYKGYGIFQYDLQFVKTDESFFREKKWYSFDECLQRVIKELSVKYSITNNIDKAVVKYNGVGRDAENYGKNVKALMGFI